MNLWELVATVWLVVALAVTVLLSRILGAGKDHQ